MTTTEHPTTPAPTEPTTPLFWLVPGAYVTPRDGEDAGQLYRVTRLTTTGATRATLVELEHTTTGEWGIAAPYDLDPADGPED